MKKTLLLIAFLVTTYNYAQWNPVGQEIYGEEGDFFTGTTVAMNAEGNIIAVYDSFINGTNAGRVRVFEMQNDVWEQLGNDIPGLLGDGQSDGRLGINAAGTRLILSNVNHEFNGEYSGGVRIFELQNETWTQLGETLYGEQTGDFFGFDVDISADGNNIIIGAIQDSFLTQKTGFVKTFSYSNNMWVQKGQTIFGAEIDDKAGFSVSMSNDGNTVAVASPYNDSTFPDAGHVIIYEFANDLWIQKGNPINGTNDNSNLGYTELGSSAIDLNGNGLTIAVSSVFYPGNDLNGQVSVFNFQGNTWELVGEEIQIIDYVPSIVLNNAGDVVMAGAPFGDIGAVRVFKNKNSQWTQIGETIIDGIEPTEFTFGYCIASNYAGDRVLIGFPLADSGTNNNSGKTLVFQNNDILSVSENLVKSKMELYPNPNNGNFSLRFSEPFENVSVQLIDIAGMEIFSSNYSSSEVIQFNKNLSAGMYFVKVVEDNVQVVLKMMVE